MEAGKKFAESERGRLREVDEVDREEAKEKKKEKKRKRKEGEREENGDEGPIAALALVNDDDGYVSPGFDLPSDSGSEDERSFVPPSKRPKTKSSKPSNSMTLEEQEELALQLLRSRR